MRKTALITGATSGIGLAIARRLDEEGCRVLLNYAHDDEAARAALALTRNGALIKADCASLEGVEDIAGAVAEPLDYLVLNCGLTDRSPFGRISPENWARIMDANVNMPFFLVQALCERMREGGSVAAISSRLASLPHAMSVSYGVSKAALSALCRNLVKYLSPRGVTINAIEPGFIDTPWQKEKPPAQRARVEAKTALRRFGRPEEVAALCYAALTNPYINGSVLRIDGGYCLE